MNAEKKIHIGRFTYVDFPELSLKTVLAKIDTGSYRGTLHCTDVKLVKKQNQTYLSFVPLDLKHPNFSHRPVLTKHYTTTNVKNSHGILQMRYVIKTPIIINGRKHSIQLSLSDRTDMSAPVLLGRKFLHGKYIVDVDITDSTGGKS